MSIGVICGNCSVGRHDHCQDGTTPGVIGGWYMVEAFLDGRGYDPGDKIDVEVTLKEGFHTVLAEMREDQAAGTATYDGLFPFGPPSTWAAS